MHGAETEQKQEPKGLTWDGMDAIMGRQHSFSGTRLH